MAIIMAMSAVVIDSADDFSADDAAYEIDFPRPRNGMAMTLEFCVSRESHDAIGEVAVSSRQTGEGFDSGSRR